MATASVNSGGVTAIDLTAPGSGYLTAGGIKKFQDGLPMLCDPSAGHCALTRREQPGPVPPAGGARHHDLHGNGST